MMYKGYTACYEFVPEEGVLHGHVEGINDMITFVAESVDDLEREFHTSVDVYLDWCAESGHEPNRPAIGRTRAAS